MQQSEPMTNDSRQPPATTKQTAASRVGAVILVAVYFLGILAVCAWVRPLEGNWAALSGIVLFPALVCALLGIGKVIRGRPIGLLILFHLVVYPIAAAIVIGLPGALVALQVAKLFAK